MVSNCYVKSPASQRCLGFAGGSYRDMTRVACLNESVWAELFLMNREALLSEIDQLISAMDQTRQAIAAGDRAGLEELLRQGRESKEEIDRQGTP